VNERSFSALKLLFYSFLLLGCENHADEYLIIKKQSVFPLPAISGVERDIKNWLFIDDIHGRIYQIHRNTSFFTEENQRFRFRFKESIPQGKGKIDLEAITLFKWKGKTGCLVLPSGTKWPNRNLGLVCLDLEKNTFIPIDCAGFYEQLMDKAKLDLDELNIEGLAVCENRLFLFNRGKNKLIECSLSSFLESVSNGFSKRLKMKVFSIHLPELDGVEAGFSGATFDDISGMLYFSASVEKKQSQLTDGAILGSFIGRINPNQLVKHMTPKCLLLKKNSNPLPVKVESLVMQGGGKIPRLFLISDGDGKPSHCFEVEWATK
jgi:hypothetical protein